MKKINITHALVAAIVLFSLGSCYKPSCYIKPCNQVFSEITVNENPTLLADAKSVDTITLKLPIADDTLNSSMIITVSDGYFQESGTKQYITNFTTVDSTGMFRVITAHLVSSATPATNVITFKSSKYTCVQTDSIVFAKNLPDTISLTANPFFVVQDSSMTVQVIAKLKSKAGGTVSKNTKVSFVYSDTTPAANSASRFYFQSTVVLSDTTGAATNNIIYFDKDTAVQKPLGIKVWVTTKAGLVDTASVNVDVIP